MLKKLGYMICGAFIVAMIGSATAIIGTPPGTGPGLVDGAWLNGLAAGHNRTAQASLTAAGTTQATSTQLAAQVALYQVQTTNQPSAGVALPAAVASGIEAKIFNSTQLSVTVYPSILNNAVTAAQDTINNTTSFATISPSNTVSCFVVRAGQWGCK